MAVLPLLTAGIVVFLVGWAFAASRGRVRALVGPIPPAAPVIAASGRGWVRLRLGLAAALLVLDGYAVIAHPHPTTVEHLYADAAAHRMSKVTFSPANGDAGGHITWRTGVTHWSVVLPEASPHVELDFGAPLASDSVESELKRSAPDVEQVRQRPTSSVNASGIAFALFPGGVALIFLGILLLLVLVEGPEPWRATRWAWFWIAVMMPFGALAFLLLSGTTPKLPVPTRGRRTAGVAFVFCLFAGSLLRTMLGASYV